MKFYVVKDSEGAVIGCEFSQRGAVKVGREQSPEGFSVDRIDIDIAPREALRLLLGCHGGYASGQTTVVAMTPDAEE